MKPSNGKNYTMKFQRFSHFAAFLDYALTICDGLHERRLMRFYLTIRSGYDLRIRWAVRVEQALGDLPWPESFLSGGAFGVVTNCWFIGA